MRGPLGDGRRGVRHGLLSSRAWRAETVPSTITRAGRGRHFDACAGPAVHTRVRATKCPSGRPAPAHSVQAGGAVGAVRVGV
ncbi:hypothetical protein GCM10023336_22150 [Streptomyces similanensis]|uniref:Uncharacterized protein n=1 Tax=Streptomyces similanensis TaxID=1274988 RepID=A0ABP9K7F4_9ACTN